MIDGFEVARCGSCGVLYVINPVSSDEIPNLYPESYFGDFHRGRPSEWVPFLQEINRQRLRRIEAMKSRSTILDIGCGIGLFLEEARRRGWETKGVEVSSEAAGYAKKKLNLEVLVGRAEEVTFPRESVDVVTLWHLLEHLEKPLTVLQGLQEALRPGGLLVVETPNARDPRGHRRLWRGDGHPRFHRFVFTPRALRWALVQAGFLRIKFVHWGYRLPESSLSGRLFRPACRLLKRTLSWAGRDSVVTCLAWKERPSSLSS